MRDGETDAEFLLRIRTPLFLSERSEEAGSVRVQFDRLDQHLPVHPDSGRFHAPASFELQMRATRQAHHLAFGLKASEYSLLFKILGYQVVFACPVRAESDIEISDYDAA